MSCSTYMENVYYLVCLFFSSRLTESPFKVHVEKLSLEQWKMDRDKELYLTPLEIKLKHSTVHMDEACPLLAPNPGVSAIHDYADWARKASEDPTMAESESRMILFTEWFGLEKPFQLRESQLCPPCPQPRA